MNRDSWTLKNFPNYFIILSFRTENTEKKIDGRGMFIQNILPPNRFVYL